MGKTHRSDGGGNKAARVAQKEQAALDKQRAERAREDDEADSRWSQGAKRGGKKEEQAAKRADQLAQKAQRDAILAQEEEETPGRREPRKTKQATKKSNKGSLNLSQLDGDGDNSDAEESKKLTTVNASGIDNALDAFGLDDDDGNAGGNKVEKHPERRFPAAYARFEERRLEEMKEDGSGDGLRMNQRKVQIRKEFERHPDNPFNQTTATYNATKEELREIRAGEAAAIESRLAANDDDE
jgi:hypothetical protein